MISLNKNNVIFTLMVIVLALFVVVFMFLILSAPKKESFVFTQKQIPTPSTIETPYNRLNQLSPGKSTIVDVDKIAGAPASVKKRGDKTYLYYNTPVSGDKNVIILLNDKVIYVLEYVFGNYRGTYGNYKTKLGVPSFVLYDYPYPWSVFLTNGIMLQSTNNFITKIVYFVPQNEEGFYKNISPELGLSKSNVNNDQGEALPTPAP